MPPFKAKPDTCYWELTRFCRLDCLHCRSHTTRPQAGEIGLEDALRIADQLVELGVGCVVLSGGEPIEYSGWEQVAARLATGGVRVRLFLSGWGFDHRTRDRALDAGITQFAVSLDGPRRIHERLRPSPFGGGSTFDAAIRAIELLVPVARQTRVVTQVNALNVGSLIETFRLIDEMHVSRWQVHLCQMSGSADDRRSELTLDPKDLEKIVAVLLIAGRERRVHAPMHCTLGYMTVEEPVLRNRNQPGRLVWDGCGAGLTTMSITPTGALKGCVTLPDSFATGDVRSARLDDWWAADDGFPYARNWSPDILADECARCAFSVTCRAGCRSVAYTSTGSIGANPYCLKIVRDAQGR